MFLCMYVAMSENRFLRFLPFRFFRVSHSMMCQNMIGRPYTHVPGRMQPWDAFHESPCISPERVILLSEYLVSNRKSS
jgi:hypothetical protein